ncbi:hypothetical protein KOR42_32110 [Thalassoglobus neptunius]|uniref:Uncharacterized protein n=1 Tax=Thalassoglobus neptunius TaxID=1938619 RepID=A0A5C5WP63_9PLAN|nr:hypothetical protein KOR42_32110 [Thalassoglobus neptunius]
MGHGGLSLTKLISLTEGKRVDSRWGKSRTFSGLDSNLNLSHLRELSQFLRRGGCINRRYL